VVGQSRKYVMRFNVTFGKGGTLQVSDCTRL
jgi:hypothetical protein